MGAARNHRNADHLFQLWSRLAVLVAWLAGILISLAARQGHGIKYDVPALLTTVFLNLFPIRRGRQSGPRFFAGLARDGLKFVTVVPIKVLKLRTAMLLGPSAGPGFQPALQDLRGNHPGRKLSGPLRRGRRAGPDCGFFRPFFL